MPNPFTLEDVGGIPGGQILRGILGGQMDDIGRLRAQILTEAQGLKGENFTRAASGVGTISVDGTIYFCLTPFLAGDVVTNIHPAVSTVGATMTLAKVGIYTPAGARLATSADLGQDWATLGIRTNALSAPFTIPVSGGYYLALVAKASVTLPTFLRQCQAQGAQMAGVGSGAAVFGSQTAQTDLIASATIVTTNTVGYWLGWS